MGDNDKIELLVGVCVTRRDWHLYRKTLEESFYNIFYYWGNKCLVYIVVQGKDDSLLLEGLSSDKSNVLFYETEEMGVSKARNNCIEKAIGLDVNYIVFHDASIRWPIESVKFLFENKDVLIPVKVRPHFSLTNIELQDKEERKERDVNPIYDTYIWSYLLHVANLKGLRFDEEIGPGNNTTYKSGEDVLFLFDYFSIAQSFTVLECSTRFVYHPPRPENYEKHLIYAAGQGRLFRVLLNRYPSYGLIRDIILFFGNALVRCFLWKPKSMKILLLRLSGFIKGV